ncbi:alpha/beta-hydrolase [Hypoxylon sp. NC1633]|nr:alpha/beta-hydrolase [Hypoxylon sp. NC1633]
MDTSKPAIILSHGAWHSPSHYTILKTKLEAQGYEVFIPKLPSSSGQGGATWRDDVEQIHATVEPHMDMGKEFVMACHSYGGIPGCIASKGYTVKERKEEGKKGGFRAILFIAAFALPRAGISLSEFLDGNYAPWVELEASNPENKLCYANSLAKQCLYNDLPEDEVQKYFDALTPQSQDSFEARVDFVPSMLDIPKAYLICESDAAIPPVAQEMLAAAIPGMRIERCSAGHSEFISQPDRVIEFLKISVLMTWLVGQPPYEADAEWTELAPAPAQAWTCRSSFTAKPPLTID